MGGGGEVVGQRHPRYAKAPAQFGRSKRPRQIGQFGAVPVGRAGDAEAGGFDGRAVDEEFAEQRVESRVVGAGETLLMDDADPARIAFRQRQQGLGAAEVAAENHHRLDRHRSGDVRVRIVAVEAEILEAEGKDVLDLGVDPHRRQGARFA